MYRRPTSYRSPYHYTNYHDPNYYYYNMPPHMQQSQQIPYQPQPYETPFEYFAKPNQFENWPEFMQQNPNFYPPPPLNQPTGTNPPPSFMNQFQNAEGQVDFNKMLSTVGQLANTVQQVSPMIKQFGSFMKKV